jgi:Rod binding domain-containing protein
MDGFLELQMMNATGEARARSGPNITQVRTEEDARRVAEEFEGFFLSQMIEQMFSQVGQDNPFGGGPGENAFRGLLHEEYAKVMSQAGGLGLADRLTTEILRYQEEGEM